MESPLSTSGPIAVDASQPTRSADDRIALSRKAQFGFIMVATAAIAIAASQFAARWFGLPAVQATYRRIGPETGPQVFCAGSSLLQFGISWPQVSAVLKQGMENWGVGGSSPEEWEMSQLLATNSNLMIIGVSAFDLNEYHLCNSRANLVPLFRTLQDLSSNGTSWQFAKRLLSQYPLAYLRKIIPTAGNSDPVLVGVRRLLPEHFRSNAAAEDRANAMVLPDKAVFDFGGSTEKLSEWSAAKTLRRLATVRSENRGLHAFNGPKHRAFLRMLQRADRQGRIVVAVMPVSPAYANAFITPEIQSRFEESLAEAQKSFPKAQFVRIDRLAPLQLAENFTDLVHLNGDGRVIATEAFLNALKQNFALQ